MSLEEKTIKSERIYDGKIINFRVDTVELANKGYTKREIVEHPGAVGILALTEECEILLVEQYRKPIEMVLLEIPAGKIEKDEAPNLTAIRELEEETGYRTESLEYLMEIFTSPGFSDERIHLFFFFFIVKVSDKLGVDDENLRLVKIKLNDAIKKIEYGEIVDSKTVMALLYLDKFLGDKHGL